MIEWDDTEPAEPELSYSGDRWHDVTNELGYWTYTRRPPLTARLREHLHPIEVAYFEGRSVWAQMVDYAGRLMGWRMVLGVGPEEVAGDAMEAMLDKGFEPGSPSWVKMSRDIMRKRVTDQLRRMSGVDGSKRHVERFKIVDGEYVSLRTRHPGGDDPEDDLVDWDPLAGIPAPEFVPQVFSDELVSTLANVCTPRELEALRWTYEADLNNGQTAQKMECPENAVAILLTRSREKLRVKGFDLVIR